MRTDHRLLLVSLLTLFSACLRPARERAELDNKVGKYETEEIKINVSQGLAAVHNLEKSKFKFWLQAPEIEFTFENTGSVELDLEVQLHNTLPEIEVECIDENIEACVVQLENTSVLTRKLLRLTLPVGSKYNLHLKATDTSSSVFKIALLSDIQEELPRVLDIINKMNEPEDVLFAISAGDLTDNGIKEQIVKFQDSFEALNYPFYSTPGNHDVGMASSRIWHEMFGRNSFSFVFSDTRFTFVDSANATVDPLVHDQLDKWLELGKDQVHLFITHIPLVDPDGFRNGSFRSRNESAKILSKLAAYKVDLTLYGHIHSLYHYENAGIEAYISGGGGGWPEKLDDIGRHFLLITIDPSRGIEKVETIRVD
ncbi:MAG: metallophosphoesterase [Deltaproteobacteria bacterium]|jgi:Icc protein|nr:metallophosphoesterase [Deltaproteobacteria bacterium]